MRLTFSFILVFIVASLVVSGTFAKILYIDADTGALVEQKPSNWGLWPLENFEDPHCEESVDAQYTDHDDRYRVDEWLFVARDYRHQGAVATEVAIYDLQELVIAAHKAGVWHVPRDCGAVWHEMRKQILVPSLTQLGQQSRSTISARQFGLIIDLQCRENHTEEYEPCTAQQLHAITSARPGMPLRSHFRN